VRFISRARQLLGELPDGDLTKETLRYLMVNGHTSKRNPVPIDTVVAHLNAIGLCTQRGDLIERKYFQHAVLVPSREESLFIGMFGSFGRGGIYLITDRADAAQARDFYLQRLGREREHLANLERLIREEWPSDA